MISVRVGFASVITLGVILVFSLSAASAFTATDPGVRGGLPELEIRFPVLLPTRLPFSTRALPGSRRWTRCRTGWVQGSIWTVAPGVMPSLRLGGLVLL